ncbi:hypothetical protein MKEN_00227300 [Mycena kentingensis (nom. inval.)]|nr:hypothetical protein MKEN_00227300 [Mycena kentingensis (nom. inval.)]
MFDASILAPELWLSILQQLPTTELVSFAATNRHFALLGRPLLFRHFEFAPYGLDLASELEEQLYQVSEEAFPAELERTRFWCSEEIAPLVRTCSIRAWDPAERPRSRKCAGDPFALLDIFFELIARFAGLRRLVLDRIDLSAEQRVSAIAKGLLLLEDLEVRIPRDVPGIPALPDLQPATRLTHFDLSAADDDALINWTPFLDPQHLRDLALDCDLHSWVSIPAFPNVTALCATITSGPEPQHFDRFFASFPNVERLLLISDEDVLASDIADTARGCRPMLDSDSLTSLAVAHEFLGAFLLPPPARLTQLRINSGPGAEELVGILAGRVLPSVVLLQLDLTIPDPALLFDVMRSFPALREAHIEMTDCEDYDAQTRASTALPFLQALASPSSDSDVVFWPTTLENVYLSWGDVDRIVTGHRLAGPRHDFPSFNSVAKHRPAEVIFARLREALMARMPVLDSLWIDGHSFLFVWRRGTSVTGRWDVCTDDADLADETAAIVDEFWATRRRVVPTHTLV